MFNDPFDPLLNAPDLGDVELMKKWAAIAQAMHDLRLIDHDYAKGVAYDILSRFLKQPGGAAAMADAYEIVMNALAIMRQRQQHALN